MGSTMYDADGDVRPSFVVGVIGAVIAGIFLFVWAILILGGFKATPPDKVALHYTGGPLQGVHFKSVVPPGKGVKFYGINENFYKYPATQRNYIVDPSETVGDRAVKDFIPTTTKDKQEADWHIISTFDLNTDPHVIRAFHEQLGLKFHAWTDKGWNSLLDQTLRQVLENRMNSEVGKYTLDEVYANPAIRQAIQDSVGRDLKDGVNDLVHGDFFCGPSFDRLHPSVCPPLKFLIKGRPTIPDSLKAQYEHNQQAELAVQQKDFEVQQAKKQAEAAAALNAAIANNPNYVLLKAIESGKITFWVLPQGSNYTLNPGK